MFVRTLLAASMTIAAVASDVHAIATFDQTISNVTYGIRSEERAAGFDYRSADDFILPGSETVTLRHVTIEMVGPGLEGFLPSPSKFGFTMFNNSGIGGDHPGTAIRTKLGATVVWDMGPAGGTFFGLGYRRYQVRFDVLSDPYWSYHGPTRFVQGRKYWISGFANRPDSNWWYFATGARESTHLSPAHSAPNYLSGGWRWLSLGTGGPVSHSFKIISY